MEGEEIMRRRPLKFSAVFVILVFLVALGVREGFSEDKASVEPQISLNITDNATLSGRFTVEITVTGDVTKVEFYINSNKILDMYRSSINVSNLYHYVWNTTRVKDGPYTITVKAIDSKGNIVSKSVPVEVKNTGELEWEESSMGNEFSGANSIQQTTDGGYIVAGGTESFGEGSYVYVLKLDSDSNLIWERTLPFP